MTTLPDDQIDPYESRLARRVDAFAEQAVRPIDPVAIASAAHAGARRQTLTGRLFGWTGRTGSTARLALVLAGTLVAAAFGVYIGAGGKLGVGPAATGPAATPTTVPGSVAACRATDLAGTITGWDGAAGHRIASIELGNSSSTACSVPKLLRPAVVDANGRAYMIGTRPGATSELTLEPGRHATTLVDMANYCGTPPAAPLRIRLYLPSEDSVDAVSSASLAGLMDLPPCNGENAPQTIEMQPLKQ